MSPFEVGVTATRKALPKPEILAYPLDTPVIESVVLRAAGVSADSSGPYKGRRYLLAGTVLSKREDGTYEVYAGTGHTNPVNEVQKITIKAKKGNWKATYEAAQTGNLAFNITAAELQAALEGLATITPGDISVTGGPGNENGATPYIVTFNTPGNVSQITVADVTLEEGGDAAEAVTVTAGVTEVEGSQAIAGILFETWEFADETTGSNEPAAMLRKDVSFDWRKIQNYEALKNELAEFAKATNCEFVDAKQTNVSGA